MTEVFVHPYPCDAAYVQKLFAEAVRGSDNFSRTAQRYGGHVLEAGSVYSHYRPTAPDALAMLDVVPKSFPQNLMIYRQCWHQQLAGRADVVEKLRYKNISHTRYFMDVERMVQLCFRQFVCGGEGSTSYSRGVLTDAAKQHAALFAAYYFDAPNMVDLGCVMLTSTATPEHIRPGLWASSLALHFASQLLGYPLHPAQLVETGWYADAPAPPASSIQLAFAAGYRLGMELLEKLFAFRSHYTTSDTQLISLLAEQLASVATDLRPYTSQLMDETSAMALAQHAASQHQEEILYQLYEACQQARIRQDMAVHSMQQFLKPYLLEEVEEDDHLLRDQNQERNNAIQEMEGQTNDQVVEAGVTILEFFKNMIFGDRAETQAMEVNEEAQEQATSSDNNSGSTSNSGNKKTKVNLEIQDMEFEVSINGEETKKLKLTQIFNALKSGQSVKFASKAQARTFVNAVTKMAQQMGMDAGVNWNQIQFVQKGQLQSMTEQVMQEIEEEQSRSHQVQLMQQLLMQQHAHKLDHILQPEAGAHHHHHVAPQHHLDAPAAAHHGTASDTAISQASEHKQASAHAATDTTQAHPSAPPEGHISTTPGEQRSEHSPKNQHANAAKIASHQASTNLTDMFAEVHDISKPDAPHAKPDASKQMER